MKTRSSDFRSPHLAAIFVPLLVLVGLLLAGCEDATLPGIGRDDPAGVEVTTPDGVRMYRELRGATSGNGIVLDRGTEAQIRVSFLNSAGDPIDLAAAGMSLRGTVVNTHVARFHQQGQTGGAIEGRNPPSTTITFDVMRGTERRFSSLPVPIVVR
jgi:predicted small secreted protein